MLLRDGIKTYWGWLQCSVLLDVATAVVGRAKAGPSRSDSCKDTGAGPVKRGGWLLVGFHFLSSPRGDRPPAPSCRVALMLLGALKR